MKTEMFVLCDAANENHGKMYLLGTFDHIYSNTTPAVHPSCAVAGIIRFDKIEEGQHKSKITFCDADGKLVLPELEGILNMAFPPNASTAVHHMVLNIQGLKLESYGEYSIDLAIDGRLEASTPLYVSPIPNAPQFGT